MQISVNRHSLLIKYLLIIKIQVLQKYATLLAKRVRFMQEYAIKILWDKDDLHKRSIMMAKERQQDSRDKIFYKKYFAKKDEISSLPNQI